jgi:hypothetical protein
MAHRIVKIIINNDGDKEINPKWHLSVNRAGSDCALCTGEFYGYGEGVAEAIEKTVDKGGITCKDCLAYIKEIKSVTI